MKNRWKYILIMYRYLCYQTVTLFDIWYLIKQWRICFKMKHMQRRWTNRTDGFENIAYSERSRIVVGWGKVADVIKRWKIFHSKYGICPEPEDIFVSTWSGNTCGHRFKKVQKLFSLDCKRRSFALRVTFTWNSFPYDIVALEFLESFKRDIHWYLNENLFYFV